MNVFLVALKRNFLNIPMMVSIVFFSILMIYILGSFTEGLQVSGVSVAEKVALYNHLENEGLKEGLNTLLGDPKFSQLFEIVTLTSSQEGYDGVKNGDYISFIDAGKIDGKEQIVLNSSNPSTILYSVLNAFTLSVHLSMNANVNEQADLQNQMVLKRIEDGKGKPTGIDYYCVQTLFQILIFGGILGVFAIREDYEKNTFARMKVSPTSRGKIIFARAIANTIFLMSMCFIVMAISSMLYNANWNGDFLVIGSVVMLESLIINGLGMLSASMTRSTGAAIGILSIALLLWSKMSGAFDPEPTRGVLANLSPNVHAKNAIYSTVYGGSLEVQLKAIIALIIYSMVLYGLLVLTERRNAHVYIQE